jgi:hypothetical protein
MGAVVAALRGDQQAQAVVSNLLGYMMREDAPEPMRRFATALTRLISGERDDSLLDGLPADLAAPLQALLEQLNATG